MSLMVWNKLSLARFMPKITPPCDLLGKNLRTAVSAVCVGGSASRPEQDTAASLQNKQSEISFSFIRETGGKERMKNDEKREDPMELPQPESALPEEQLEAVSGGTDTRSASKSAPGCPKCGGFNLVRLSRGIVCLDCGHSIVTEQPYV